MAQMEGAAWGSREQSPTNEQAATPPMTSGTPRASAGTTPINNAESPPQNRGAAAPTAARQSSTVAEDSDEHSPPRASLCRPCAVVARCRALVIAVTVVLLLVVTGGIIIAAVLLTQSNGEAFPQLCVECLVRSSQAQEGDSLKSCPVAATEF